MKRAAIYARVSSKEQATEGVSIPAQLKTLKQYALENGYEITHEFVDRGESARTDDRPEFQNMIATAKKKPKPFDVILVHKTDRFARNREDSIIYKSLLRRECGIDVISVTEKFDDTPTGKMMEGIMEVVAEFYSANLAKEVLKGMNEKASYGGALGEPPYGYTIDKKSSKFKIYEPEAKVVKYIFRQYINGSSLRTIGMDLRRNGKKMFGDAALFKVSKAVKNNGKYKEQKLTWKPNTIRHILSNKTYVGDFSWNNTIIKSNHPAIISRDNFNLVQNLLLKRKTRRRQSENYILRGLVTCYECGGSLTQLNQRYTTKNGIKKIYKSLRCSNHVRLGNCYSNLHKMEEVEKTIYNFLINMANSKINYNDLNITRVQNEDIIEEYKKLTLKLNNYNIQFERQIEAFQAGIIDLNQLKKYKTKLEKEKEELQNQLNIIEEKLNTSNDDENEFWTKLKKVIKTLDDDLATVEQKNNALSSIIDEIRISKKRNTMKIIFKIS